jgi:hypothetical protein
MQCAGMYYAASDLGAAEGRGADEVETMAGTGRGAALVTETLLAFNMTEPTEAKAYTRDQVEHNRMVWRTKLGGSGNPEVMEWAVRAMS